MTREEFHKFLTAINHVSMKLRSNEREVIEAQLLDAGHDEIDDGQVDRIMAFLSGEGVVTVHETAYRILNKGKDNYQPIDQYNILYLLTKRADLEVGLWAMWGVDVPELTPYHAVAFTPEPKPLFTEKQHA